METLEKKSIRLLKKECFDCAYINEESDNSSNICIDDPECPANRMEIKVGRDFDSYVEKSAIKLIKYIDECSDDSKNKFINTITAIVRKKNTRRHIFDIVCFMYDLMCEKNK